MKRKIVFILFIFNFIKIFAYENFYDSLLKTLGKENQWLPVQYLQLIEHTDRNYIINFIPTLDKYLYLVDYLDMNCAWYDKHVFSFESISLEIMKKQSDKMVEYVFFSNNWEYTIKSIQFQSYYNVLLSQTKTSLYNTRNITQGRLWESNVKLSIDKITPLESLRKTPLYSENPAYYDEEEYKFDEILIDAKFIFDGDYLTVYANEDKFKQIYFRCTEETFEQLKSLIYTNKIDLSKVTWPRHADGSCDYDGSKKTVASQAQKATSPTNVAPNKTMTVRENLKLRSGEAVSTQVLAVMSAGAKVRILELGRAETIDGIPSNWVKVEVQKGAKDRDGNPIKPGTVGWSFGGFLE
ncbi:MAG: SH3 domain-containing protein [Treponema sp.]|nr:SH3 domain-containing protein [Treponema sp.]